MRATAVWTTVIASSVGLALAAQTAVGTGTLPESGMQARPAATVTVTGCLHRVDKTGHYTLTNASTQASGGDMLDALKFTPTESSKGAAHAATGTEWVKSKDVALVAHAASVRLDQHVGHQVEVTGSFEHVAMMGTRAMMDPPAAGTTGTADAAATPQGTTGTSALDVTSLRMIAKTCR